MSPPAQERGWASLPADLLRDILARLPWSSHPSIAATCKHWRTVVAPFYPAWLSPLLLNVVDVGSTNIRYYSPYYHKIFEVSKTIERPDAMICCSNGHHLTLSYREDDNVIVVRANLINGVIQDLYPLRYGFDFVIYDGEHRMFGISASVNCLIVVRNIEQDGDWSRHWEFSDLVSDEVDFVPSPMTNPVFHHGLLYMLAGDGRLAVYDDSRHNEGFKILDKPTNPGFEYDDFYLFESDEGELMAIFMNRRGTLLSIEKLNEHTMEWEKVDSLEGRALFTGTLMTMMVKTSVKWMQNKVFFPRLYHWPGIIQCDLVDQEGELAFVPKSSMVSQDGGVDGKNIWSCGMGNNETAKFWGSANFDYCIWVNFEKLTP
ncbi:hypothetical protein PR202_gb22733 [Eleusine coracana subsp. coracana]|uniref:F-box domain-containing protein n=1 Tax=Eleusine coracana subsp. coracana TaxID=191504 RepID=A0AAV5FEF6_ELECO|nr:hypothetical protein PR202_gb22733 [Eleusine coracana subsp. coracana]